MKDVNVQKGSNQFAIDELGNISTGIYLLELRNMMNGQKQMIRLIKD